MLTTKEPAEILVARSNVFGKKKFLNASNIVL